MAIVDSKRLHEYKEEIVRYNPGIQTRGKNKCRTLKIKRVFGYIFKEDCEVFVYSEVLNKMGFGISRRYAFY